MENYHETGIAGRSRQMTDNQLSFYVLREYTNQTKRRRMLTGKLWQQWAPSAAVCQEIPKFMEAAKTMNANAMQVIRAATDAAIKAGRTLELKPIQMFSLPIEVEKLNANYSVKIASYVNSCVASLKYLDFELENMYGTTDVSDESKACLYANVIKDPVILASYLEDTSLYTENVEYDAIQQYLLAPVVYQQHAAMFLSPSLQSHPVLPPEVLSYADKQ